MQLERRLADTLLEVARESIRAGLATGAAMTVEPEAYDSRLCETRSSFVTLKRRSRLRGCIGGLVADRPLVADVAHRAFGAAFLDPRFPRLGSEELDAITIHVAILTPSTVLRFADERDLLRQLRPGRDGLTIRRGERLATFLPAVWAEVASAGEFLSALKRKAGIPVDAPAERAERYEVIEIAESQARNG